ncbi:peptide methionine sulfoxide reductase A4, chloroplastic-like [Telopea speciosissima]|uniref:peptide methionine sulfoxide reductase A4, chloroplastic-like n=1 Tax=Telopea speciosissima TaxID=54955 RepID=UPI001CC7A695|nr:peptide methionine sulfoxide reductase A4, chloroplastic-like [Telopea speciosissima]
MAKKWIRAEETGLGAEELDSINSGKKHGKERRIKESNRVHKQSVQFLICSYSLDHSHNNMYQLLLQPKLEIPPSETKSTLAVPLEFLGEAAFAGASFWGIEAAFGGVEGVVKTATGYCGGTFRKPSHREVLEGITGHTESVKVIYDTRKITYRSLCDKFWETHDPTNKEYLSFGVSTHYRSAIFYATEEQRKQAQESKIRRQMKLNKRIVTKIIALDYSDFFHAENQHQKYYLQRNHWLCGSLNLRSTEQFTDSTTASRLNGILALDGKVAVDELERFMSSTELPKQTMLVCEGIIQDFGGKESGRKHNLITF